MPAAGLLRYVGGHGGLGLAGRAKKALPHDFASTARRTDAEGPPSIALREASDHGRGLRSKNPYGGAVRVSPRRSRGRESPAQYLETRPGRAAGLRRNAAPPHDPATARFIAGLKTRPPNGTATARLMPDERAERPAAKVAIATASSRSSLPFPAVRRCRFQLPASSFQPLPYGRC